jgi:ribosomal silencing factor RsfS
MCSVIFRQLLSMDEIVAALAKLGGINPVVIELTDKIDTITHAVIVTGNSRRHIRKMSDCIVTAVSFYFFISLSVFSL